LHSWFIVMSAQTDFFLHGTVFNEQLIGSQRIN
jgi:hypothetical protein